ncbi:hypothetical protein VTN77DRAFT_7415 [Rasamsonia byssochlamydoides]|uniref:uncharacterized protein n=1 Tax=Rasamsonia byssochlamydoides TaxID=89139 RepID=UPI0037438471
MTWDRRFLWSCVYGIPLILEQLQSEASRSGKNIDYNAKNSHGTSALYVSARYGHTNTLQFLLDQGSSIDVSGGFFGNPLQAAAFQGHEEVVRILMAKEADPFAPGKFGNVVDAAMAGGNEQVIKFLLSSEKVTRSLDVEKLLLKASYDGHYEVVRQLLSLLNSSETDKTCQGTTNNQFHDTVQMALFQGRARIARRMLKDIADINVKSGHFGNALQAAAFGGHAMMVTMVLEREADVNSRGRYGSALRAAALRGHDTVIRLLIDKGANVEGENADALQAAAFNGRLSTVKLLLDSGLYDTHKYSNVISPAVEAACFRGYREVAELFLQTYGSAAAYTGFLPLL